MILYIDLDGTGTSLTSDKSLSVMVKSPSIVLNIVGKFKDVIEGFVKLVYKTKHITSSYVDINNE